MTATVVAAEAIKRAGTTDGTKIAEESLKMKDFPIATGKFTVDKEHNPPGGFIIELKNGVQTFREKINP